MAINDLVTEPSLANVLQVSENARDLALELIDAVASAAPEPNQAGQIPPGVCEQQKLLVANLSILRGLQRKACFAARDTKAATADAKREVDRLQLQLQNLYYEQRHLEGEIDACESYEHTYTELPLIPVAEFLTAHPELADADEFDLMTARIEHERAERETLEQQRQELLKRKQKLIADNKKRKDDLANLDRDLEKFIDAGEPIQKLFEKVI